MQVANSYLYGLGAGGSDYCQFRCAQNTRSGDTATSLMRCGADEVETITFDDGSMCDCCEVRGRTGGNAPGAGSVLGGLAIALLVAVGIATASK